MVNPKMASEFLRSLYDDPIIVRDEDLVSVAERITLKIADNLSGDQVLQTLMTSFVLTNTSDLDDFKNKWVWMGGINRYASSGELMNEFAYSDMTELIEAVRQDGYEVEVVV